MILPVSKNVKNLWVYHLKAKARGVHLCVTFLRCVDAALFPTSREKLGPDATQTGCPHPLDYMEETLHTVLGRGMKGGGWSDSQIRN